MDNEELYLAFIRDNLIPKMHEEIINGKKGIIITNIFNETLFKKCLSTLSLCKFGYVKSNNTIGLISKTYESPNIDLSLLKKIKIESIYNQFKIDWFISESYKKWTSLEVKLNKLEEKIDNLFYIPGMPGYKQAEGEFKEIENKFEKEIK